jgi:hypothetical protein
MSTTMTRPPASSTTNGRGFPIEPTRRLRRQNHGRIAVGVMIIVFCVLGTVSLYSSAGERVSVLSVHRWVAPGQRITAGDITTASVSTSSGLRTLPAGARSRTVGRIAAVGLVPGTLLAPEQVRDGPQVPTGMAVVGATLKAGQYPVGLGAGDEVELVETPAATSTASTVSPKERGRAQVLDLVASSDVPGATNVALVVGSDVAAAVAAAGAAGDLSLVVVGGR